MIARANPLPGRWEPGILLAQAYASVLASGVSISTLLRETAKWDFFQWFEVPSTLAVADRTGLARQAGGNWQLMIWASDAQAEEQLNLGSPQATERRRSAQRFRDLLSVSAECGAVRFGFCSPPAGDPRRQDDAEAYLAEELVRLAQYGQKLGIQLLFEGLDRLAHKKGLIGFTPELSRLCRAVRAEAPAFGLVWDTAHSALNGEDVAEGYRRLAPHIAAVHLSEAVLDRSSAAFGDLHLPIGQGEVATPVAIQSLLTAMSDSWRDDGTALVFTIEELNSGGCRPPAEFIRRAWSHLIP